MGSGHKPVSRSFSHRRIAVQQILRIQPPFRTLNGRHPLYRSGEPIRLKAPKEDRKGRSWIVDVYATGGPSCPDHALREWKKLNKHWPAQQPAFRWDSEKPFTQNQFRNILEHRLAGYVDNPEETFCTHSFTLIPDWYGIHVGRPRIRR